MKIIPTRDLSALKRIDLRNRIERKKNAKYSIAVFKYCAWRVCTCDNTYYSDDLYQRVFEEGGRSKIFLAFAMLGSRCSDRWHSGMDRRGKDRTVISHYGSKHGGILCLPDSDNMLYRITDLKPLRKQQSRRDHT